MSCCESLQLDPAKNYETIESYLVLVVSGSGGENTETLFTSKAKAESAVKKAFTNGDTADYSVVYEYREIV